MATKQCVKCNQTKNINEFYMASQYKDGIDYYCKYCRIGSALKSQNNSKKICIVEDCQGGQYCRGYCRVHYSRLMRNGTIERKNKVVNPSRKKALSKKASNLKHYYSMDIDEFLRKSKKGCEICKEPSPFNLHVDHDHKCCPGKVSCGACVRGLICHSCNMAVDKYENNLLRPDFPIYNKIRKYVNKYA